MGATYAVQNNLHVIQNMNLVSNIKFCNEIFRCSAHLCGELWPTHATQRIQVWVHFMAAGQVAKSNAHIVPQCACQERGLHHSNQVYCVPPFFLCLSLGGKPSGCGESPGSLAITALVHGSREIKETLEPWNR